MPIPQRLIPVTILAFLAIASVAPAASSADPATAGRALVTLNFPGGTLDRFVEALERAYGQPVNLIMPEIADIPVPAIRVADVSLELVFAAIGQADAGVSFQQVGGAPQHTPVWAVHVAALQTEPQIARSYSVERLLEKYNINDITTAVKTTWDMARSDGVDRSWSRRRAGNVWITSGPDPDLKFHQETKLLIIRGSARHVELAENVVGQLSQALNTARGPVRSPEEIAALQEMALELDANRLSLEAELQELQKSSPEHPQINAVKARLRAVEARIKNITTAANAPSN